MAFEKLRTIVITAIPKPRSPRKVTQDCRNPNSDLLPVKSFSVDRDSSCLAIHSAARLVSGSHAAYEQTVFHDLRQPKRWLRLKARC
jgi:hypothetical protein